MIRHRRAVASLAAALSLGFLLPASAAEVVPEEPAADPTPTAPDAGEVAYRALTGLPVGDAATGAAGVERSAIALAETLQAVPLTEGSAAACPEERLEVSWEEPGRSYGYGAFVEPLGPAPTASTTEVNGVVTCAGAPWAFMGFEARYAGGRWDVVAVPFVDEHVEAHPEADERGHAGDHADRATARAAAAPPAGGPRAALPAAKPAALSFSGPIDGYARYEPQRTCSPTAKPGTAALQRLLLAGAPGSRSLGISRACSIGGSSEHKEGRAFDWGVLVSRPAEAAAAEDFLARLLATDEVGNRHALARRMGVMYVIWNRQIWSAYRPNDGWRPYSGRSPHTDHVHISLSWAGALGQTSFWSGQAVEGLSFGPQMASAPTGSGASAPAPSAAAPAAAGGSDHEHSAGERQRTAAEDQARQAQKAAEEQAHQAHRAAEEQAHQQQKAAEEQARQQQKAAEEQARQQQKAAEEEGRRREQAAKEQERRARQAVPSAPPAGGGGGNGAGGNGGGGGKGGKGKG